MIERPGRTQFNVVAPMTGVVTKIYPVVGETVKPNQPLFQFKLTHEDLVTKQQEFLSTSDEIKAVDIELTRLKNASNVVPKKEIIAQQSKANRLNAKISVQHQGLLMHGLTDPQVTAIRKNGTLLQEVTIRAPKTIDDEEETNFSHFFHLQKLSVKLGEQVSAGGSMAILADHCHLHIEGMAFEEDGGHLNAAIERGTKVSVVLVSDGESTQIIENLTIARLSDQIDTDSRSLHFYIDLPNRFSTEKHSTHDHTTHDKTNGEKQTDNKLSNEKNKEPKNSIMKNAPNTPKKKEKKPKRTFARWYYKPGQRMKVIVPIENASNKKLEKTHYVLPITAVVDEGAEAFVFRLNGKKFDRVPVHIIDRNQHNVAIAAGTLYENDVIAANGAYNMYLAIKNASGGAVDPHAGHNH